MIKEYLLIANTLYPMLPDGSENIDIHDSKMWNVFRGNELVGIITSSKFQPVLSMFMKYENMRVYFYDKDNSEDGETLDIYALAKHGEEVEEYDNTQNSKKLVSESMHIQEASPDQRILDKIKLQQQTINEKQHQHTIVQEASLTEPLIETLRKTNESVYNITSIFGNTIEDVITFLNSEGKIVGFDAVVSIHEERNQRCIIMHESEEHKLERERKTKELRTAAISKLTDEEKRALGIKD